MNWSNEWIFFFGCWHINKGIKSFELSEEGEMQLFYLLLFANALGIGCWNYLFSLVLTALVGRGDSGGVVGDVWEWLVFSYFLRGVGKWFSNFVILFYLLWNLIYSLRSFIFFIKELDESFDLILTGFQVSEVEIEAVWYNVEHLFFIFLTIAF